MPSVWPFIWGSWLSWKLRDVTILDVWAREQPSSRPWNMSAESWENIHEADDQVHTEGGMETFPAPHRSENN